MDGVAPSMIRLLKAYVYVRRQSPCRAAVRFAAVRGRQDVML